MLPPSNEPVVVVVPWYHGKVVPLVNTMSLWWYNTPKVGKNALPLVPHPESMRKLSRAAVIDIRKPDGGALYPPENRAASKLQAQVAMLDPVPTSIEP